MTRAVPVPMACAILLVTLAGAGCGPRPALTEEAQEQRLHEHALRSTALREDVLQALRRSDGSTSRAT